MYYSVLKHITLGSPVKINEIMVWTTQCNQNDHSPQTSKPLEYCQDCRPSTAKYNTEMYLELYTTQGKYCHKLYGSMGIPLLLRSYEVAHIAPLPCYLRKSYLDTSWHNWRWSYCPLFFTLVTNTPMTSLVYSGYHTIFSELNFFPFTSTKSSKMSLVPSGNRLSRQVSIVALKGPFTYF